MAAAALLLASPALAEDNPLAPPSEPAAAPPFDGRRNVEDFWQSKGVAPHVAAGIADRVQAESGGDPTRKGDGNTSLGLYQHHNDRMKTLLASVENEQAFKEVMGADPIAARHWNEIKAAPDRATAARLWDRYFERSAASQAAAPRPVARNPAAASVQRPAPAAPATGLTYNQMLARHFPQLGVAMANMCSEIIAAGRVKVPPACQQQAITALPQQRALAPQQPVVVAAPATMYRPALPQTSAVLALASFFHHRK